MGQYYYVVNIDKRQFLNPHKFEDGLKLLEFGLSAGGTMTALAILLADGNGRGGGDLIGAGALPVVGSWAGDRIVIAGDYADGGNFVPDDQKAREGETQPNLYTLCCERESGFVDVSGAAWEAMLRDDQIREETLDRLSDGCMNLVLSFLREPKGAAVGGHYDDPKLRLVFRGVFGDEVVDAALGKRR